MNISAHISLSRGRRVTGLSFGLVLALLVCWPAAAQRSAGPHSQFLRAQKMQIALENKTDAAQTQEEYRLTVEAYRKVYLDTPTAQDAPRALMAIGGLYCEMGDRFDKKYFHSAVVTYDFLLQEYPGSELRPDAAFAIAEIQQQRLHARKDAEASYRDFLSRFPDSPQAPDARAALAILQGGHDGNAISQSRSAAVNKKPAPARTTGQKTQDVSSVLEQPDSVDADAPVVRAKTNFGRDSQPATPSVDDTSANDGTPLVRIGGVQANEGAGHTRIVIDMDHPAKFESGRAHDPERIFFDVAHSHVSRSLLDQPLDINDGRVKSVRLGQYRPDVVRVVVDVDDAGSFSSLLLHDPDRLVIDVQAEGSAATSMPLSRESASAAETLRDTPIAPATSKPAKTLTKDDSADDAQLKDAPLPSHKVFAHGNSVPQPMRDGQGSLTRELGLKINRIVIDPGHGGHDTGTIGPHGLMEKDVCLDVALRLGKLIQKRLPGAEVFYTRHDDTFIPLEERTAIANRENADLFISIHANSSPSPSARGVETYFLNFATTPDAMQVATRENSTSQSSVHELQIADPENRAQRKSGRIPRVCHGRAGLAVTPAACFESRH